MTAAILAAIAIALAAASFYCGHRAMNQYGRDRAKLDAIARLETHGGEFVDVAELYRILGKPVPAPTDHAANIRSRYPNGA